MKRGDTSGFRALDARPSVVRTAYRTLKLPSLAVYLLH
eukprot:COSAG03_NODE_20138_length_324_cov_0.635556_1_plen_37_part_10